MDMCLILCQIFYLFINMQGIIHSTTSQKFKSIVRTNLLNTNKCINSAYGIYCRPIFSNYNKIDIDKCEKYGSVHIMLDPTMLYRNYIWTANTEETNGYNHIYSNTEINTYLQDWEKNINGEIIFKSVIYDINRLICKVYMKKTDDNLKLYSELNEKMRNSTVIYNTRGIMDV
jgi:hypothetical protein